MRLLLFLSRVAFICNLFFLLSMILIWNNFIKDEATVSTIIIIGYVMALFIFNPIVNVFYITILSLRKKLFDVVPKWLVMTNFVFLLLQLTYFIFLLNDTLPA